MKNIIFICVIIFASPVIKAQSIDSLKYELSYHKSGEKNGGKIALARILHCKLPFDRQGIRYICQYHYDRNIDSVNIFLNKLIEDYPDSTKAYIRKAEHLDFVRNINKNREKVKCLKQGYKKDSQDIEINYMLAELYYEDFLKPYYKPSWSIGVEEDEENSFIMNRPKQKQAYIDSENNALFYFHNLEKINDEMRKIVYFPIQQLERYKNKNSVVENPNLIDNDCYFPIWYFINLKDGWENDLSRNYLFELEQSPSRGLSHFLQKIDEPCLYNNENYQASEVFRFLWLRTFHNPVCLRIEKANENYTVYWKLTDGAGGYDYGELKNSKHKNITKKEWDRFKELLVAIRLSNLPNRSYYPMTDGASWTIEYKNKDMYKAHDTNIPTKYIRECCTYLLSLTSLKIKEEDIY